MLRVTQDQQAVQVLCPGGQYELKVRTWTLCACYRLMLRPAQQRQQWLWLAQKAVPTGILSAQLHVVVNAGGAQRIIMSAWPGCMQHRLASMLTCMHQQALLATDACSWHMRVCSLPGDI